MNQLLLFQDDPTDIQNRRIEVLSGKIENIRKGQFAIIRTLEKKIKELESKLEFLEAHICKNNLFLC